MPLPCVEPLPLYRPRDPRASALWRLMDQHFPTFQQVYDERYQFQHPHIHTLVTCGAFTPEGDFLEVPELDMDRLHAAWREAVFALYLAEDKIGPEVVENMRTWPHSGFSVDQSVFLPAGDRAGVERAAALGANAVLVGSSLSVAGDGAAAVSALTGVVRSARG